MQHQCWHKLFSIKVIKYSWSTQTPWNCLQLKLGTHHFHLLVMDEFVGPNWTLNWTTGVFACTMHLVYNKDEPRASKTTSIVHVESLWIVHVLGSRDNPIVLAESPQSTCTLLHSYVELSPVKILPGEEHIRSVGTACHEKCTCCCIAVKNWTISCLKFGNNHYLCPADVSSPDNSVVIDVHHVTRL